MDEQELETEIYKIIESLQKVLVSKALPENKWMGIHEALSYLNDSLPLGD